ncbi:MAG: hypothetical protein HY288_16085 [Planctomycetia bacterium]|nr:hypothetical protein [Planctomycetia bacterium]
MGKVSLKNHRGAVAPLVAVLLVPLLAMVAFTVDMGYVVRVKAELQNAADAAALAGAAELMTPQFAGILNLSALASSEITAAQAEARRFAGLNTAGNTSLSLPNSDIVVGYLANPKDQQQTLSAWSSGSLPNSVQVLMRRDSTANTPVSLFFARVLGINSCSGTATATASYIQGSKVTGFKGTTGGPNATLIPIAIDVNFWNNFISTGKSPDGTWSDSFTLTSSDTVSSGSDNVPEFNDTYPNKKSPGNFGLVSIGPPSSSVGPYQNWIDHGAAPSDLNYFGTNGLQATPSSPATLDGGPGLKSTLETNLAGIVGQPRAVPLFSQYSEQGSNSQYKIVGFVGITVVSATGNGSKMQIIIQPTSVVDSTATTGSGSGSSFVYPTPPLALVR